MRKCLASRDVSLLWIMDTSRFVGARLTAPFHEYRLRTQGIASLFRALTAARSRRGLSCLTADRLFGVFDSLAFVRFGWLDLSQLRNDAPDQLFIGADEEEPRLFFNRHFNADRHRKDHRMRKTDRQMNFTP